MSDVTPRLNLLVLRSRDVERLRKFYESLGLSFVHHKHDEGPLHYSSEQGEVVIELYTTKKDIQDNIMLGFSVSDLETTIEKIGKERIHREPFETDEGRVAMLKDPDGRLCYLLQS